MPKKGDGILRDQATSVRCTKNHVQAYNQGYGS